MNTGITEIPRITEPVRQLSEETMDECAAVKAKLTLRPSCSIYLPIVPKAVMSINLDSQATAIICAWHEGKAEADAWAKRKGLLASHGICPACSKRVMAS